MVKLICVGLFLVSAAVHAGENMERLTIHRDGRERTVTGMIQVEARDGGVLLLAQDGVLWRLQADEVIERRGTDEPFRPWSSEEMARRLRQELPEGFLVRSTPHYVLAYNTTPAYAKWCSTLYERVYRVYFQFWKRQGLVLPEPDLPLVAVIVEDRRTFEQFGRAELGDAVGSVVGYYSLESNRVLMYDLTGLEQLRGNRARPSTSTLIRQMLSQPAARPNVATIVHEATHQLCYNSTLQTRLADNPLWLSEGLAIFFETPDLRSDKGWTRAGNVHWERYRRFREDLPRRAPDALSRLITQDDALRDPAQALQGYAESWALCYFLMERREREFSAYVQELSQYEPLREKSPEERLSVFCEHFGDVQSLDREFVTFMAGLAMDARRR